MLVGEKIKLGMIIETKYEGSADLALDQTRKYISVFEEHKNIECIICLGINVSKKKQVDIKLEKEITHVTQ